ncbi:DDE-type integrase/transposase/recombinase [Geobacillus sp. WSUCF-018B]|uniref:DDE-type integrase/transposase/recombinase n=1 Tax=Geobacillus sp. WSUCF-018B TaxID=2055939 RepID=UPI000C2905F1|nr:DDE-type integrase/transposase/recombinase [Geobacillus sp. WSUCF-018B]PJW16815.1 transposase [Geobacillus sp. WSUCF-018B]
MLPQLLAYLLEIIKSQHQIIVYLIGALLGKSLSRKDMDEPVRKPYRKLQVDDLPIIDVPETLDYRQLLADYEARHGRPLPPIQRRDNAKHRVPDSLTCPRCQAPSSYLYANNGGKGQYQCKVCQCRFNHRNRFKKQAVFRCPHCFQTLEKIKERKNYYIYKCKNNDCPFYQKNLRRMSQKERQRFQQNPQAFKVRYRFREFLFDFQPLAPSSPKKPKVDLSRLAVSSHTLGLVLTYYVNYGMSSRQTAGIMKDVHGVSISHQTVLNYANSVALMIQPFVDQFPYELSGSFCGDETYIRVKGRWHYLFFMFDAVKKVVLSYRVSPHRDALSAIRAIDDVLRKLPSIPDDLSFVVDGNPIYLLAQHFFAQHGIPFDVRQVIGLTNEDPVSEEFRALKQIIERFNRTFKGNYRPTHGFGAEEGSVSFVTLFVAYFNFLRPHGALEGRVPVVIPELADLPHMPARWTKLIAMAQDFLQQEAA